MTVFFLERHRKMKKVEKNDSADNEWRWRGGEWQWLGGSGTSR
jgi:hypothetical protein